MTIENSMESMRKNSYLTGGSADYLEEMYEKFLQDPASINADWRNYFESVANKQDVSHTDIRHYFAELAKQHKAVSVVSSDNNKQSAVEELIYAYRDFGHFQAKLDPLGLAPNPPIAELELNYHGLNDADLDKEFIPDHFADGKPRTLRKLFGELKDVYCNTIGFEYMHITIPSELRWLQQRLEIPQFRAAFSATQKKRILQCLTAADGLEKYLGTRYVGQKRFSLEGGDSLIPMLDELIQRAGNQQIKEIVIGMAHRGRLNVLVNIVGKAPQQLFSEFEGKLSDEKRSGDVKYHMGFSSDVTTDKGNVHLVLAFNPSHLEIVSPVVEGSVKARQQRHNGNGVLPVQIHGDAAFAGQGVVMETFALSQTRGHGTGGSVHIVVNNQVGFTTDARDARSTFYCTDVAKIVQAPIFHVNGDDPEAVLFVTQLALDYRMTFGKDVVIDLICYRRHGHNEADEPSATQPVMYQKIKALATLRQLYAEQLVKNNVITNDEASKWVTEYRDALDAGKTTLPMLVPHPREKAGQWTSYINQSWDTPTKTAVEASVLKKLATTLETLPANMTLQAQVGKTIEERRQMTQGKLPLNWGYAETLAYATLLNEGFSIRLSGQDVGRGTFAHRHSVLHDYKTGETFIPLDQIAKKPVLFNVVDSILSEEAVLAFEYGYASADAKTLVLWEAQFGDFANGAQVVIDQFISSGEQKWGRLCGLVMLLPHGYEGLGPEHSSARLERYLQLCAQENMQVCTPTTPAQMFHLLRRQMIRPFRKPLIVMTPKSALRHKLAVSSLQELSSGGFALVIPEMDDIGTDQIQRVIICCGKFYYDLLEERRATKKNNIAIVRVEQLYPFPEKELAAILAKYKNAKEIAWCQEEPQNQGAWLAVKQHLENVIKKDQQLNYIGRAASASPAVGSGKLHIEQQKQLVKDALS